MKFLGILFLMTAVLTFLLPVMLSLGHPYPAAPPAEQTAPSSSPSGQPDSTTAPQTTAASSRRDTGIPVRLLHDGGILNLTMEEYLFGVVAAEMPADFSHHALCAQAVAARTTTLYHIQGADHPAHPSADMCSSAAWN